MQRNLRNAALQFREAFDVEVGRAVLSLQVGPVTARDGASEQYTDRYEAWVDTSEHPRLVSDIFVVDAVGRGPADPEVRPGHRTSSSRPRGPKRIARWRPDFERQLRDFNAGQPVDRRFGLTDEESLVISPLRNLIGPGRAGCAPGVDHAGLRLHDPPARRALHAGGNPAGAGAALLHPPGRRQLSRGGRLGQRSPSRVLYRSDPDAPTDPASADASRTVLRARAPAARASSSGAAVAAAASASAGRQGPLDERRLRGRRCVRRRDEERGPLAAASSSTPAGRSKPRWPARGGATWPSASACCCCSASASGCSPPPRAARTGSPSSRWSSWPASPTSCARRSR